MLRVPTVDGPVWFKACGAVQAFEPRLTAELSARWPDRVANVLAHDVERVWLLMADAGTSVAQLGNAPELWLEALPGYAELQRGEVAHAADHLAHGVPDLRLARLPARFRELVERDLPIGSGEAARLRRFEPHLADLCAELAADAALESVQHDDLHLWNLYSRGPDLRVLDWGDASIGHPFASLVVTFRFLEQINGLAPGDPWFARLRDAYLEPWGPGLTHAFDLAMRIGTIAHACASLRQRDALPADGRPDFDTDFVEVLRRAVLQTPE